MNSRVKGYNYYSLLFERTVMKIRYDKKEDTVYVELAKGKYDRTRKVTDSVLVDEDGKGKILDAKKNIKAFDPQKTKFEIQSV